MKYSVKTWEKAIADCLFGRKDIANTIIWISPPLIEILQTGKCFNQDDGTFNGVDCFKWPKNTAGYDKPNFYIMNENS